MTQLRWDEALGGWALQVTDTPVDELVQATALVSEGQCPRGHGRLAPGRHDYYGWCYPCDRGFSASSDDDLTVDPPGPAFTEWFPGPGDQGPALPLA